MGWRWAVGMGLLALWGWGGPASALPTAETSYGEGQVEAEYQLGGLGELDRYGLRLAGDFGAREDFGVGLALTRMFGTERTGARVHTTFGELYLKYQFRERVRPQDWAAALLLGYRFVRERQETLSGVVFAGVANLALTERASLRVRLGLNAFENNSMTDFLIGVGLRVQRNLELGLAFQSFSVDSTTEGGVLAGLTYRYSSARAEPPSGYWWGRE